MIKTVVDSDKALRDLAELAVELRLPAVKAGLRRAGSMMARTMKSLAPSDKGRLRKSISSRQLSLSAGDRIDVFGGRNVEAQSAVLVGPNINVRGRLSSSVALWLEEGTRAHEIKGRKGGMLEFEGFFARKVNHPGIRPQPFMQRAAEATPVESLFYEGLSRYIERKSA